MEKRIYTQSGTFSVAILLPIFIFTLVMLVITGFDEPFVAVVLGFVSITFLICLLIFYKIVITVDDTRLSFRLGSGLVKKSYMLSEITGCKPVKNPLWYGIGIRFTPDGWLYNVSGLHAIELTFKNKKGKIRIGTDMPEEVAAYINQRISSISSGIITEKSSKIPVILFMSILFLAFIIPAALLLKGNKDIDVSILEEKLTINGMYGISLIYSDITEIDTVTTLPPIKSRTNGFATGKTLRGHFKLDDGQKVRLYIKKQNPPYISIKTKNISLWLNFKDRKKTLQTFNEIISHK